METQDWIIEDGDGDYRVRGTYDEVRTYARQIHPGGTITRG